MHSRRANRLMRFSRRGALVGSCSALAALGVAACLDRELIAPAAASTESESMIAPAALAVEGCAQFEVKLLGVNSIEVRVERSDECGPLHPVLDGQPRFDRTVGRVWLPIALENGGAVAVRAPARLFGWPDSLVVVEPRGLAGNRTQGPNVAFVNPDSVAADDDAELPGARLWSYDDRLDPSGGAGVLPAGGRSGARTLELSVHRSVQVFRVALRARAERQGVQVPEQAPDTVPQWVFADSNLVTNTEHSAGTFPRNVVSILFREGSTREQRQAAIDLIGGEVVGGVPVLGGRGFYLVRITHDGTDAPLFEAIRRLQELPQVEFAGPEYVLKSPGNYLTPAEGPGWQVWRVDADSADGENWALERIAAPLAWGCSIGDRAAPVAVVDWGFHPDTQLAANIDLQRSFAIGHVPATVQHGTSVAAVAAAVGNDTTGMTGVMWHAALRLYEAGVDSLGQPTLSSAGQPVLRISQVVDRIERAARAGAKVINISLGLDWDSIVAPGYQPHTSSDSMLVRAAFVQRLVPMLRALEQAGHRPLLILTAGNNGLNDAFWNGFPAILDSLPGRALVVAAADSARTQHGNLAGFSNRGRLVDLAAPGQGVRTLRGGQIVALNGTSLAAPLVTGIAGLLLSSNPNLTREQLRELILRGAIDGGRTAGGFPLANAYWSLRRGAEIPGTPLCGNRIWLADGYVRARRGSTVEDLFPFPVAGAYMNALHGGRRLRITDLDQSRRRTFVLENGAWVERPDSLLPPAVNGATYLSAFELSHNGDSAVVVDMWYLQNSTEFTVSLVTAAGQQTVLHVLSVPTGPTPGGTEVCGWATLSDGVYTCQQTVWTSGHISASYRAAYSPLGDRVWLAINRIRYSFTGLTDMAPCQGTEFSSDGRAVHLCREFTFEHRSDGVDVYAISIPDGSRTHLWSDPSGEVYWIGVSEGGIEEVAGIGVMRSPSRVVFVRSLFGPHYILQTRMESQTISDCRHEFRVIATGQVERIPSASVCSANIGTGTLAAPPPVIASGVRPSEPVRWRP